LTQLTVSGKDAKRTYDVVVQPDYDLLRNLIKRTVPTAAVEVTPGIGNVVILSGYVSSPQDADIIARLANSAVGGTAQNVINAVQVGGVQHVQTDVVGASVDRNATRSRAFEQVGTQLEVLPIVYANGQIWLEINPQVRTVNQGLGITTVFGTTPGFTEQQARCAVMLESGQTFAIGGLIQSSVQGSSAKVP